jgi:hypothetical protein
MPRTVLKGVSHWLWAPGQGHGTARAEGLLPQMIKAVLSALALYPRGMTPRSWIAAGWVFVVAAAGLAIAAIVEALDAVNSPYLSQRFAAYGLAPVPWRAAAAVFVRVIICAVFAGVAFFSGLACFFWAAHRRTVEEITRIRQS